MVHNRRSLLLGLALGTAFSWQSLLLAAEEFQPVVPDAEVVVTDKSPSPVAPAPIDVAPAVEKELKIEVITERYPSRAVKIERHVAQDTDGNYFNHGLWTYWDQHGVVVATGEYKHGQRHGKWVRWIEDVKGTLMEGAAYKTFEAPFVSEAHFVDGQLHGTWTIFDARNRKASEWEFEYGQLHGKSVWWFTTGQKAREIDFRHGQIDGQLLEWSLVTPPGAAPAGKLAAGTEPVHKLITKATYQNGRRHGQQVEMYTSGQKKVEGWYLYAREVAESNHDWWSSVSKTTITGKEGVDQKHGLWTWYGLDGGKILEGEYLNNDPVGVHTWWFANGQKKIEGRFEAGKQEGKWTWWHENGQKHVEGTYAAGDQHGTWTMWSDEGKVVEVQDIAVSAAPANIATIEVEPEATQKIPAVVTPKSTAPQPRVGRPVAPRQFRR